MKAIVESTPTLEKLNSSEQDILMKQFFSVLRRITVNKSRDEITESLDYFKEQVCYLNESHHLHWGFGGSHMWVKQRGNDNRLIFVEL